MKAVCPFCGNKMDCATETIERKPPQVNDITICLECLNLAQFNDDLTLRKMDVETYIDLINDKEKLERIEGLRMVVRWIKNLKKK